MRFLLLAFLTGAGCEGGLHRTGDRNVSVLLHAGIPIEREVFDLDGKGDAHNVGFSLAGHWYNEDRMAITLAVTPVLLYDLSEGTSYGAEAQVGPRFHLWERGRVGLLFDLLGGIAYFTRSVPEAGKHFNYTLEFGPGVEYVLNDTTRLQFGYRFRHLSDGRGQVAGNPSQNDHRIWVGLSFDW